MDSKKLETEFIVRVLKNIFGVEATKIILNYMENKHNIVKNQIPDNIDDFYKNITNKRYGNSTVLPSVRSNLTTVLGRKAAYEHAQVTWKEMMNANEKIDPKLRGLRS